ncbi:excinuclease ABC subunit UvrA [Sodalis sp. CWE]|uniref:excinuclease ABC subunit UvrA n=1 Tax=Sodalis sp. CWE TaxID=2803816 RepID=UPI001C7D8AB7|nr:excinuclease ABC subunit UvrA [Sodalis sp. CWE]MBX4180769.1 excinuclease ABC subunit UvrA [Sodalis sp. CWE]
MYEIKIHGANAHNLKNISLTLPHNKLIVITGLSGSGKSSLAFDIIYAEGQYRYTKVLPIYIRRFLPSIKKPNVDRIEGLSPTITVARKSMFSNSRSTVGTVTEIYDYLRLLFARIGEPYCPNHNIPLAVLSIRQMVDNVLLKQEGKRLMLLAPILINGQQEEYKKKLKDLIKEGYIRIRINGKIFNLLKLSTLDTTQEKLKIEVVIDRFKVCKNLSQRLIESFETALILSKGKVILVDMEDQEKETLFSNNFSCSICGYSANKLVPRFFSFNNPYGACPDCKGTGFLNYLDPEKIFRNKNISLAKGAIHGWNQNNSDHFQILCSLAEHYKFDIEEPFCKLDYKIQQKILFGSKENIKIKYINNGTVSEQYLPFEGIVSNIERRYNNAEPAIRKRFAKYINSRFCINCGGTRLRQEARKVFLEHISLPEISEMQVSYALSFFENIKISKQRAKIAGEVLNEICKRLKFLVDIGLDYLSLSCPVGTLSTGEVQRIHLVNQMNTELIGVVFVFDEPTIGLHQRDNIQLLQMLMNLRNAGNTVIVIENDKSIIQIADHIVDMGPGAGCNGGRIVAKGTIEEIMANPTSITGQFLSKKEDIVIPKKRVVADTSRMLKLIGAHGNNLKNVTLSLPVGLITCITGVSGSGKSTLISNTLYPAVQSQFNKNITFSKAKPYHHIQGLEYFDKIIKVDQNPIDRISCSSNTATFTGIFTLIRTLFASVPESRARGYTTSRFSFNTQGGRCETCQGHGIIKTEMYFLSDTYVRCDQCNGQRYNRETLEIKYKKKSIYQILEMSLEEAYEFFSAIPILANKIRMLIDIGLSYICLGNPITILSKGEAQRIKLAQELSKNRIGRTLYILDEPTIGLHCFDIRKLLTILYKLRNQGNTIVIIEHNLDIIKTADWIVDLGPEGGISGGQIIVSGTPEVVADCKISYTGQLLKPILKCKT